MTNPSFSSRVSNSGGGEGEKKAGYINYEVEPGFTVRLRQNLDPAMDPKKFRRIISHRIASQKSKWKKRQYVDYLVKRARELHWRLSVLRRREMILSEQKRRAENEKRRAEKENMELQECLSAWCQHLIFQKGKIEARRAEIESLNKQLTPPN